MKDLDYIKLSGNYLTGDMPKISEVANLRLIDFSDNRLDGKFHWPEQAPELRELILSQNEIMDTIQSPEGLKNLEKFHISDRKSTRLNSSHVAISYAVFCLKKKKKTDAPRTD